MRQGTGASTSSRVGSHQERTHSREHQSRSRESDSQRFLAEPGFGRGFSTASAERRARATQHLPRSADLCPKRPVSTPRRWVGNAAPFDAASTHPDASGRADTLNVRVNTSRRDYNRRSSGWTTRPRTGSTRDDDTVIVRRLHAAYVYSVTTSGVARRTRRSHSSSIRPGGKPVLQVEMKGDSEARAKRGGSMPKWGLPGSEREPAC